MTNGNSVPDNICRVTNKNDIVPWVPSEIFGFLHTAHEIWINDDKPTVKCHDIANGAIVKDPNRNAEHYYTILTLSATMSFKVSLASKIYIETSSGSKTSVERISLGY
ncbi:hypothetical protein K7432_010274 [Basidiobolus ranarum]|uniref:Uncharacterized protein n=1 Tax=Basidiobolus ranarum TaxID=34480 RepID=A0ABR2VW66_9FUNG